MGFITSCKKEIFYLWFPVPLKLSYISTHVFWIDTLFSTHLCLASVTLLRDFKCLPITLHIPESYVFCSYFSLSWPVKFVYSYYNMRFLGGPERQCWFTSYSIRTCCCFDAATYLSLSHVAAVAVTASTMTIQVLPTPPLVTLSVRWWNVTLMVILQVSNFLLLLSQGPDRFPFPSSSEALWEKGIP